MGGAGGGARQLEWGVARGRGRWAWPGGGAWERIGAGPWPNGRGLDDQVGVGTTNHDVDIRLIL